MLQTRQGQADTTEARAEEEQPASSLFGKKKEWDVEACWVKGKRYMPMYMKDSKGKKVRRSEETDPHACAARCKKVPGCAHFAFWPDGGCLLSDENATQVGEDDGKPTSAYVSGPP